MTPWLHALEFMVQQSGMMQDGGLFENDVFLLKEYCWCDDSVNCLWCLHGNNPDRDRLLLEKFGNVYHYRKATQYGDPPNFWHKASDLRITWYKHIGRGDAANMDIHALDLEKIGQHCMQSIGFTLKEAELIYECRFAIERKGFKAIRSALDKAMTVWKVAK